MSVVVTGLSGKPTGKPQPFLTGFVADSASKKYMAAR